MEKYLNSDKMSTLNGLFHSHHSFSPFIVYFCLNIIKDIRIFFIASLSIFVIYTILNEFYLVIT